MNMLTKEKLDACVTQGDLQELFSRCTIAELEEYLDAVEPARKFIGLTRRDEFILFVVRTTYDKLCGNLPNPVQPTHENGPQ